VAKLSFRPCVSGTGKDKEPIVAASRGGGRRDTGAMADSIRVAPDTEIPLAEIELRASRSSGPGGQHANVTASRVEAVLEIDASRALSEEQKRRLRARHGRRVTAVAQEARGQARNRELALRRLGERIEAALRPRRRRTPTRPSRGARERRLAAKRRRGQRKRERGRPDEGA
jgi:ribosome-associated protein